ncbi:MAG: ATP-binding protein, partial [Gammaproteobacteria bacterium]|nr:ATP-binding protein [Gammaproteobacteria bacterium]
MKFYNREQELAQLERQEILKTDGSVMTVLTGRRRIGKTELVLEHVKNHRFLYLFITRKNEHLLCNDFVASIRKEFDFPILGEIKRFPDLFRLLLEISKTEPFTLIIDEFQDFFYINDTIYSEIQKYWDLNKNNSHLHVIFVGSIYSLMHKIFQDKKEPLFGRADKIIHLNPFSIKTLAMILSDQKAFSGKNLFDLYVITGGSPKYIDIFLKNKATTFKMMLECIFEKDSLFLQEGKYLLIEAFGKEYSTYFSILALIASGKNSRNELSSFLDKDVGSYLQRLREDYAIISVIKPINALPKNRLQKYKIKDNFLSFWFR